MSMGGITSIALVGVAPELVRRLVLVDGTPGVTAEKAKAITDFVNGPASFPSFEDLLARTIQHNPTRTESSLRRGILHNAVQLDDGSWEWRYRRFRLPEAPPPSGPTTTGCGTSSAYHCPSCWCGACAPIGGRDRDETSLLERVPSYIERREAGHSVQGDDPLTLAQLLDFVLTGALLALAQRSPYGALDGPDDALGWSAPDPPGPLIACVGFNSARPT
jgi:pimeloyl-ACP methyl ester carboxylesterase